MFFYKYVFVFEIEDTNYAIIQCECVGVGNKSYNKTLTNSIFNLFIMCYHEQGI